MHRLNWADWADSILVIISWTMPPCREVSQAELRILNSREIKISVISHSHTHSLFVFVFFFIFSEYRIIMAFSDGRSRGISLGLRIPALLLNILSIICFSYAFPEGMLIWLILVLFLLFVWQTTKLTRSTSSPL